MESFHKEANTSKGTEILYFEDAELIKSRGGQNIFATTGPLSVLYVKEFKRFFLQINDWRYPLMRRIPITKEGTQASPSYILPGLSDASYKITLGNLGNREIVSNFETILNHNSNFSSSGEENTLRKLEVSPDDKLTRKVNPVRKESGVKDVISEGLKTVTDKVKGTFKGSKGHSMKKKRSNLSEIKAKDFKADAKSTFKKNFFNSSTKLSNEFLNRRKDNINLTQLREFNDLRKTADNVAASLYIGKEEFEEAILDTKDIISQKGYTMEPLEKKGIMQSLRHGITGIRESITGALGGHKTEGTEGGDNTSTSTETSTTTTTTTTHTRRSETGGISQHRPSREIISVHDKIEKVPASEGMSHYA